MRAMNKTNVRIRVFVFVFVLLFALLEIKAFGFFV